METNRDPLDIKYIESTGSTSFKIGVVAKVSYRW